MATLLGPLAQVLNVQSPPTPGRPAPAPLSEDCGAGPGGRDPPCLSEACLPSPAPLPLSCRGYSIQKLLCGVLCGALPPRPLGQCVACASCLSCSVPCPSCPLGDTGLPFLSFPHPSRGLPTPVVTACGVKRESLRGQLFPVWATAWLCPPGPGGGCGPSLPDPAQCWPLPPSSRSLPAAGSLRSSASSTG